jgi:hypothetical protein
MGTKAVSQQKTPRSAGREHPFHRLRKWQGPASYLLEKFFKIGKVMEIELHQWIIGVPTRQVGFSEEEAKVIAYSSQHVDENDVRFTVKDRASEKVYMNSLLSGKNRGEAR